MARIILDVELIDGEIKIQDVFVEGKEKVEEEKVRHWAEEYMEKLTNKGFDIDLNIRDFDDVVTYGDVLKLADILTTEPELKIDVTPVPKPEVKPVEKPNVKPRPVFEVVTERSEGDYSFVAIPFDKILETRVVISPNVQRQTTLPEFQSMYGFDYIINGGFVSTSADTNWVFKSVNTVFDGTRFESSGDFSDFTMNIKRDGSIEFGEFTRINTTSAIGGSPSLIVDGKIHIDHSVGHENDRHPRSAIGVTEDALIMLAVNGRANGRGATLQEVAEYMLDLGVVNAINLDGGGSSKLTNKDRDINKPLANRKMHNAIGVWIKE